MLEAELEGRPDDANLRQALGITYAGLGRKEDALRMASEAAAIHPIDQEPYFGGSTLIEVALIKTMVGEFGAALETLDAKGPRGFRISQRPRNPTTTKDVGS